MSVPRCGNCRLWKPTDSQQGVCRLIYGRYNPNQPRFTFSTYSSEYCPQHRPKDQARRDTCRTQGSMV